MSAPKRGRQRGWSRSPRRYACRLRDPTARLRITTYTGGPACAFTFGRNGEVTDDRIADEPYEADACSIHPHRNRAADRRGSELCSAAVDRGGCPYDSPARG